MSAIESSNKRIAKNTLYMYARMGITMLVSLYTSRIVLGALGDDDYGIYNVVASFIVAFTFISNPLGTATQRFISYELGKSNETERVGSVFNLSLKIYLLLVVLLVIVIEAVGIYFVNEKMQVPEGRLGVVQFVFQVSVASLAINMLKTPFEAMVVAYEKMSFFAWLAIAEVLLMLLNAFSLVWLGGDRLKVYAVNRLIISVVVFLLFCAFCFRSFEASKIRRVQDKGLFKQLLSFSGWSLFGAASSMAADQGLNILLNLFYGVKVNAAYGISHQVSAAVNQFVSNFQIAFRPQIVKTYAGDDVSRLHDLIYTTSKLSYLLLFAIVFPLVLNMDFVLAIWLKNVPAYTSFFCILILIYSLVESLTAPLWMTVQATGNIKKYQITISCVMFLNVIFSYVALCCGAPPTSVLLIKVCLCFYYMVVRMLFVRKLTGLGLRLFAQKVLLPVLVVSIIVGGATCLFAVNRSGASRFLVSLAVFLPTYCLLAYFVGLTKENRAAIRLMIKTKNR
ncbi:MAG: lipopolysaccharide biosynthesis protein [Bacteroidales bacterium]|nr:lipopolysaccharide biosynthesis protein [Bacteroidales bacterium]